MTNKLVVFINSFKVPKIKKILLYEIKFLVPNYSCLQNPWLGGYRPPDPHSLCPLTSTEFVEPPPRTKFQGTPLVVTINNCVFDTAIVRMFVCQVTENFGTFECFGLYHFYSFPYESTLYFTRSSNLTLCNSVKNDVCVEAFASNKRLFQRRLGLHRQSSDTIQHPSCPNYVSFLRWCGC